MSIGIMDSCAAIMVRDTVLFKEQPGFSISESSWAVVTDVLLKNKEKAIVVVEEHLNEMSLLAAKLKKDGVKFKEKDVHTAWRDPTSFMAVDKIEKKSAFVEQSRKQLQMKTHDLCPDPIRSRTTEERSSKRRRPEN
ncbi:hypothetical protein OUZ56_021925 [Daphnia magna]|uniref:Uncharacterized protein n=1 Tax=Daphnia magna TaxID=35525 RepID=A0ABR0AUV1_9CRUS|nr:hypothetical protein OUZ56_021925 [Daphnia magna]